MRVREREFDALRPAVIVLPGQPIPQPFRPVPVYFISGTYSPTGNVDTVEVKPAIKSPIARHGTCPNIGKLVAVAIAQGCDGLIMSTPVVVVGVRTIVVGGSAVAALCPDCQEERCMYAQVIKPVQTPAGGNIRGLSSMLHTEEAGCRGRGRKAQVHI